MLLRNRLQLDPFLHEILISRNTRKAKSALRVFFGLCYRSAIDK